MATAQRIINGVGAQGLLLIARTAQQVLLVPFFIAAWGTTLFGDWLVWFAAAELLMLLDLGLQPVLVARLIKHRVAGAEGAFHQTVSLFAGLYVAIVAASLLSLCLVVAWGGLDFLLVTSELDIVSARITLLLLAATTVTSLFTAIAGAIFRARDQYPLSQHVDTGRMAIEVAGSIAALLAGAGPVILAAIRFSALLLSNGLWAGRYIWRKHGDIPWRLSRPDAQSSSLIFKDAGLYFVNASADPILVAAPTLLFDLLGVPRAQIVLFTVTRTLVNLLRQMSKHMLHASAIEMAADFAAGQFEQAGKLLQMTARLITVTAAGLAGLMVVLVPPFVEYWTHGSSRPDYLFVAIFAFGVAAAAPVQAMAEFLHYAKFPRALAAAALLQNCLLIALCTLLIPYFGVTGAAAGIVIAVFAGLAAAVLPTAARRLYINRWPFLQSAAVRGPASAVLMLSISWLVWQAMGLESGLHAIFLGMVMLIPLAVICYGLGLDRAQRDWLRSYLKALSTNSR